MSPGRPFRFLYFMLCLWFVSRAAAWMLSGVEIMSAAASRTGQSVQPPAMPLTRPYPVLNPPASFAPSLPESGKNRPPIVREAEARSGLHPVPGGQAIPPLRARAPEGQRIFHIPPDGSIAPFPAPPAGRPARDRWSLSAWLLYRPEYAGVRLANAGQLGASQAGARLAYDLTPGASYALAIHGRASTAFAAPVQAEGAVGLTLRPVRTVPVALSVERRFNIEEGGRDAFAAYLSGGLDAAALPADLELEGYAQAGMVGASRTDMFADGRIAISRSLPGDAGAARIAGGLAVSGGVQPSLSRLDIGPQISIRFPLGFGHARLAVEWRERIAGNARPASGPAVILASDF